ncbi:MAG: TRAP transporter substrate-binding protein DctP [Thermodesulfobacteriota bacterium]
MKLKLRFLAPCLLALLLGVALWPSAAPAANKVYKLKAESVYGPLSTTTTVGLYKYLDLVEKKSLGQIKFGRFAAGALAKAKEALDAIEVGMFDVLLSYPSYYAGHVPEGEIFLTPFMFKSMKNIYDVYYNTEVGALLHQAYQKKGSVLVGLQFMAANVLVTRDKVSSLAGLKGLKIRAPGGLGAKTVTVMGSAPVMLVGSEIYTGLQRGTIDGYIYPLYSTWDYKFYEQAKYVVQPSLGYIITYIWMSKKTYDSLPPDLRKIVMEAGKEHAAYTLAWAQQEDAKVWTKLKGVGVQQVNLPQADVDSLIKTLRSKIWPTYGVNERCKKIMDISLKHEGWK